MLNRVQIATTIELTIAVEPISISTLQAMGNNVSFKSGAVQMRPKDKRPETSTVGTGEANKPTQSDEQPLTAPLRQQ